jgi:squalene cyclase
MDFDPQHLVARQNPDGGWGYHGDTSWTEPTVYALLALTSEKTGQAARPQSAALEWLRRSQREDGGWAPHPRVNQSTWVTSLALLLLARQTEAGDLPKAIGWVIAQTGRESGLLHRLRLWMLGVKSEYEETQDGWPWFPGTAAWAVPTSLTILALQRLAQQHPSAAITRRIESGQRFLLSRMCADGGWNHGSSRALGYEAPSYPETTGVALVALKDVQPPKLENSVATALRHLHTCRSAEGVSWLQLGLRAHGVTSPAIDETRIRCRTTCDVALRIIARSNAL